MSELSGPRVDPTSQLKWDVRVPRPGRVGKVKSPPCVETDVSWKELSSGAKREVLGSLLCTVCNVRPRVCNPGQYVRLLSAAQSSACAVRCKCCQSGRSADSICTVRLARSYFRQVERVKNWPVRGFFSAPMASGTVQVSVKLL